jgi:hypothetical protein
MDFNQKKFQDLFVDKIPSNKDLNIILEDITPVGKLSTQGCLNTYHKDYIARLTEALGEFFESIWMVLGDEDFFSVAKSYILKTPSTSYDLGQYGKSFPQFLAKHNRSEDFPFLEDLAQLELDFLHVFHLKALAAKVFDEKELANIKNMSFIFSSQLILKESAYAIVSIWKSKNQDAGNQANLDFYKPERFLIYKIKKNTLIKIFTEQQYLILQSLIAGDTVQQSLIQVEGQKKAETNPIDIQELFQFLMESGIIIASQ